MSDDTENKYLSPAMAALRKHDFYVYDLALRLKWSQSGIDILRKLQDGATYIVDNNVSWKSLAAVSQSFCFVIGGTLSEEANDLDGVLFSKMPPEGYSNVFVATIHESETSGVVLNRLDKHYKDAVFANKIPTLPNTFPGHRSDQLFAAATFRQQIQNNLSRASDDLRREMLMRRDCSRGNLENAGIASVLATVLLLQDANTRRLQTKLDPDYVQFPGDSRLIAEALFWGFSILSNDERDVHVLGELIGVPVVSEKDLRSGQVGRIAAAKSLDTAGA